MLNDSGFESAARPSQVVGRAPRRGPGCGSTPRADLAALLAAGAAGVTGPAAPVSAATTALPAVASAKDAANQSLPTGVTSLAERRGRKRRLAVVRRRRRRGHDPGCRCGGCLQRGLPAQCQQDRGVILPARRGTVLQPRSSVQPSPSQVPALPAPAATFGPGTAPHGSQAVGQTAQAPRAPRRPDTRRPPCGRDGILPTPGQRPESPGLPGGGRNGGGEATCRAFRAALHQPWPRRRSRKRQGLPGLLEMA